MKIRTEKKDSATPSLEPSSGVPLCIRFANTLSDRPLSEDESLFNYTDLLEWSRSAALHEPADLDRLASLARRDAASSQIAYAKAIALREAIYRIFVGLREPDPAAESDLETLNDAATSALCCARLVETAGVVRWAWHRPGEDLRSPLWPIARSAADLVTSPDAERIGCCSSENCSWLFIDRSPTRKRRWCDMKVCGNRAKARRHYERRRARPKSAGQSP